MASPEGIDLIGEPAEAELPPEKTLEEEGPGGATEDARDQDDDTTPEDPMRAAWWWIDRWRRSTAYTDMNLTERGAYRELLDECWLRDGIIPDDETVLMRIVGCTPEEWSKIRDKVLARFKKVAGGLRNETADEVMHQSKRRAENQRRYRERQQADNGADNAPGNEPDSPSPSPSPSPSKSPSPKKRSSRTKTSVPAKKTTWWSKEACDDWEARFGEGTATGRIGRGLKKVVDRYGWEFIRPVWQRYLRDEKAQFCNPQDFASKLAAWAKRQVPRSKGEEHVARVRAALERFLEKEK